MIVKQKFWALKVVILLTVGLLSVKAMANFQSLNDFGENPGNLTASYYKTSLPNNALVVLLHGCVQNGEQLAKKSGFYQLAQANRFNLVIPQQNHKNNIKDCFNWFSPQDTSRNSGELKSIVNMVKHVAKNIEQPRVFVVGLSAGGAMATSLLSQYPSMFEAGAIVAGLPFPCADNLTKAISCMRNGPSQTPKELAEQVKKLNKAEQTNWPSISIWTGSKDQVVNPINSQYLAKQWLFLIGQKNHPNVAHEKGYKRSLWESDGRAKVELVELEHLGHGLPVNPEQMYGGKEGDFILKSPLSSALEITEFWQL